MKPSGQFVSVGNAVLVTPRGLEPGESCDFIEGSGTLRDSEPVAASVENTPNVTTPEAPYDCLNDSLDVDAVLVTAIEGATSAGRFDVVSQLCRELEARRLARAGNVVGIDSRRHWPDGHK
jgi:hypothetical protein